MKACPYCQEPPGWFYARNVSMTRRTPHFVLCGCPHAERFGSVDTKLKHFVADADRAAWEAKWDEHAEKLFAEYTARWTDEQRTSFRARIWPKPPPPTELFNRNNDEAPNVAYHGYAPDEDPFAQ